MAGTLYRCPCGASVFAGQGVPQSALFCGLCGAEAALLVRESAVGGVPGSAGGPPWRGLGDLLAWFFGRLGLKPWPGCGCQARREWLNRWFPFRWPNKMPWAKSRPKV